MGKSVFESAGFRHDIRFRPEEREYGEGFVKVFVCICIIGGLIIGMILFRFAGTNEPFGDTYSYHQTQKKDVEIHKGSFIYLAPVTSDDSYLGDLPERIVLRGVITYIPEFKVSNEESYIGIDATYFQQFQSEDFHLEKDKDGIIWIPLHRVKVLTPDTIP